MKPSVALGRDTIMLREIVDKAASRVGRELKSQPLVGADLLNLLGGVYLELGEYGKAEAMAREALVMRRKATPLPLLTAARARTEMAPSSRRAKRHRERRALLPFARTWPGCWTPNMVG